MEVRNDVILLTGAAGGLGSTMAHLLSSKGAILYLLDLDEDKGKALEASIRKKRGKAFFERLDVTAEEEWISLIKKIVRTEGHIDCLINNAGINIRKPVEEMSWQEWNKMMEVNVGSMFLGIKHILPVMKGQKNGSIINTSSVCGLIGHRFTPEAYTVSKGAVTLFTKSIAARYGRFGIRCNSVHPSTVDTPLVQAVLNDPQKRQERLDEVPLGRLATADDIANAVLFLASHESSFINGVALPVDGGATCC